MPDRQKSPGRLKASVSLGEVTGFPNRVNRLVLDLVIGPGHQLSEQAEDDELHAGEKEEGGEDGQRVAVHAQPLEKLHVEGGRPGED